MITSARREETQLSTLERVDGHHEPNRSFKSALITSLLSY